MPQGSSASPGWFVKAINEVAKGLEQVAAYLDDAIILDSDPSAHVKTTRGLFERLRKHHLKRRLPISWALHLERAPKRRESVGFDSHAHAPRPEAAALSPRWPFVLPKVSARYVQTDSTNYGPPQKGRQFFVHTEHGSHCA